MASCVAAEVDIIFCSECELLNAPFGTTTCEFSRDRCTNIQDLASSNKESRVQRSLVVKGVFLASKTT